LVRFFGLFGIYYSLKYLSLSDAVVLTFLSPTTTAVAGFLFLRESLSRKEAIAGRESLSCYFFAYPDKCPVSVFSLVGVVLIAHRKEDKGSERLLLRHCSVPILPRESLSQFRPLERLLFPRHHLKD
jgi:EamA-like transporter family